MDYRQLVRMIAAGRVVIGATLTLAPGFAGGQWVGEVAQRKDAKVMIRAMGVRDLALGAGALQALSSGDPVRSWVLMGALSDVIDFTATALALRQLGARRALPVLAVAATAATIGALSADQLDD